MARQRIGSRMSVILDEELRKEIEAVMAETGDAVASVLRKAIKAGLAGVKSGGKPDVLTPDSELSRDLDTVAKEMQMPRGKVFLDAARVGLQPVYNRAMREKVIAEQNKNPEEAAAMLAIMQQSDMADDPGAREIHSAL